MKEQTQNIPIQKTKFSLASLEKVTETFSLTEKLIFYFSSLVLTISCIVLLSYLNNSFLVSIPGEGGTFTEGMVGYPRFINPILSYTETGQDLATLIYSGLLKTRPDGTLVNDLAKEYSISEDGLTYTFTLKDKIYFHDGEPVTTADIEFTVKKALDPALKSPLRVQWEGVGIEVVNEKTIKFVLKKPYAPFLDNLTLGILPQHIWKNADLEQFTFSKFNTEPVGSGPYKIVHTERDAQGIPLYYTLEAFSKHALGKPKIRNIVVRFYPTFDQLLEAYKNGDIESMNALSGEEASHITNPDTDIKYAPLPRVFGIFFNQNQSAILSEKEVREALNISIDRKKIIEEVFHGYGVAIDGPVPPTLLTAEENSEANIDIESEIAKAKELLKKAGWSENENGFFEKKIKNVTTPLEFTISTSNTSELTKTADIIKEQWKKIGINVTVKVFEQGDFNQTILRPRKYEALLFGEIIGRDLDLYSFWHSGERNDPGLNIALYTNSKVDKALSEVRDLSNEEERTKRLDIIREEIAKDIPAIFLYSPDYIYILPKKIKNFQMEELLKPGDRYANVEEWYINEERVWKIFAE